MNLTRCSNGHFYDIDKFSQCPHCAASGVGADNVTVAMAPGQQQQRARSEDSVTVPLRPSLEEQVKMAGVAAPAQEKDEKTVSYFKTAIGSDPVVGWLVCVEGNNFGKDYRLKSGRNFIGRSADMDVAITGDNTVSRERHAALIFEPRKLQFLVQAGDSKELCYLNDQVVLTTTEIKLNDVLTVGETKLMFIPCCSDKFNWDSLKNWDALSLKKDAAQ
jgi:hypothetical protein